MCRCWELDCDIWTGRVPVPGHLLTLSLVEGRMCCRRDLSFRSLAGLILWTWTLLWTVQSSESLEMDPEGYIAFCPCMGRFGNQADQFLGALAFAKSINRTFIIPHWVEYVPYEAGSNQVPFSTYFKPDGIQKFHRAVTMDFFMAKIAPKIWPPEKRISFCYAERNIDSGCDAKDGNPFGPYWDAFGVDFVGSEIFGPNLHYIGNLASYEVWSNKYPGDNWPVLAFVGSPGAFPVEQKTLHLQEYLEWNDVLKKEASKFISKLPKGPFIGIHLRNGIDWSRACELVDGTRDLFASPQCTGYGQKVGRLNMEMCLPSLNTIIKQLRRAVKKRNATSIFVASDRSHMMNELTSALKPMGVSVHHLDRNSPHLDLVILGESNLFIGNCVSSFSSFVKRERDVKGFPTEFWGYPPVVKSKSSRSHMEL